MSTKDSAEKAKKQPAKKAETGEESTKTKGKRATKTSPEKKAIAPGKTETVVGEKSLVYIDYTGTTKEDGLLFDTTLEEVAKEKELYKENERYEPMLVAIGWNWLLAALEEQLVGMKVGDKRVVEVPPEKGAGLRDPNLVKTIPKTKLAKHGVRPIKGTEVNFGRERGVISQVLGRTVRVDFNPPLSGKTLVFDVIIKEIISDPVEKLLAVVNRRVPGLKRDQFSASISGKTITIELPKETRYIENIQYAEIGIAADALKVVEKATEVKLVTTWPRPEAPKENKT
ncbi:MAG: FKBP-type peptidyl-prolyl cis-trans isomerase [Candidatus Thorarchaeota archaeon]